MDPAVVEQLVKEMGLSELDTEQREQLMASLGDLLETRLSEVLANRMDDAQFGEFEKLANGGDPNAVLNYIRMIVPDYDQLLRTEMDKVKVEFGAEAAELVASMEEYKQAAAALAQADEQLAVAGAETSGQPAVPAQTPEPSQMPQPMPLKVPQIGDKPITTPPPPFPPQAPAPQTVPTTEATPTTNPIPPNDFV